MHFKTSRGGISRRLLVATPVAAIAASSVLARAGSARADDDVTSIEYWSPPQNGLNESGTKALLQPIVDGFKKETGITVNLQIIDWSSLLSKLAAAIASNTGPDIAAGGNTWNGIYSDTGGVVSWTPEMMEEIGGMSQFVPAFTQVMGYPGKDPISIPTGGGTWQLVYNKKILADAGITKLPTTWNEFIADAKKSPRSRRCTTRNAGGISRIGHGSGISTDGRASICRPTCRPWWVARRWCAPHDASSRCGPLTASGW
ncbi:hypothetical protein BWR60_00705 [Inquilinus limosus]|uniref:ABC transporter substrate-binding protein n=1 Tax=Inquilinus limosus TaxID=171674 RepID=A0A211ZV54_9PROT|nr:extracellular solute-binding protein [Inquilinus limosus]OWJ69094.1 hypothetical protein BWR60_00705 [Inquilinus limosus]